MQELIKLKKDIDKKNNEYDILIGLIEDVETTKRYIQMKTKDKRKLEKEFNKLMPDICPLCGQEVK